MINLLSPAEEPNTDLLRVVRLGMEGRTKITVTAVVAEEIPEATPEGAEDRAHFIRQRLTMFAEEPISRDRRAERDALAEELFTKLWPNAVQGSRTWEHGRRDCKHLASLTLCGGGVFVTLDGPLHRKARLNSQELQCEVLRPDELLQRLPSRATLDRVRFDAVVRRARRDDADAVTRLMSPIRDSYPDFDRWWAGAVDTKETFVGEFEGTIAGISVWSKKDDRVVKLSTFYVGDDHRGRGLGPHLLFHQLRHWVAERVEKVFVTVSSERLPVLDFFFNYGFRLEGASSRRYKAGATEFILSKHFFYEEVGDPAFEGFLGRLTRELFSLPATPRVQDPARWFMAPRQQDLRAARDDSGAVVGVGVYDGERQAHLLGVNDFEELAYPARMALGGRDAFMIPIKPAWADALMEIPRPQGSLFANTDKLRLRTDNAYYCTPRLGPSRLTNSPVLFYVSTPDKGIAGFARILDCRIASAEDLYVEFGDIGIYSLDDIREHVRDGGGEYGGKAMALRFAWWVPFERLVHLDTMRSEFELEHPQTVTPIRYATYTSILKAGGIDW